MMVSKQKQTRGQQPFLLLCVELFFIVFSIHINGFDGLFTLRNLDMALVIAIYLFFYSRKKSDNITRSIDSKWIQGMLIFFLYSFFIALINGVSYSQDQSTLRYIINFMIMVVMISNLLSKMEFNSNRVALAMIWITTVQSLIVILCFLSPTFKAIIFNMQSWEEDWLSYRVSGLGIAGAGGTVYLFCGFLANCYYLLFYKKQVIYYITLLLILFSTMLVGRTGFYMEVVMVLFVGYKIISDPHNKSKITRLSGIVSASILLLLTINVIQNRTQVDYDMIESSYYRLGDIYEGETVNAVREMGVPALTIKNLFLGAGVVRGYTVDGVKSWSDSGYVQRFVGWGLIPALLSYILLLWYLMSLTKRINDKKKRQFWMLPIFMMFVVEYKEPFIFYLALPFVLILFLKIETYNNTKGIVLN